MDSKALKVLLVEDNPDDAQLIKLGLSKAGTQFIIQCAECMSEAIARLHGGRFDAILADLHLPDSHGLETIVQIRRQAPNIPIVVLAGMADDEIALASLEQGAQDYLPKHTLSHETLDRTIRYAIQRQRNAEMRCLLDKLQASEQLFERKNRRLSQLYKAAHHAADNVSHEFRTPLTVVMEYVSLLRDGVVGPVTAEQCQMLDIVGDRADDLNNMVDDMLDISKLEAGMLGVYRERCQIAAIIGRLQSSLEKKAALRKAHFTIAVEDNLPDVFCDTHKVARVIINLAVNAIKYCGTAGQVELWAKNDPAAGQVLVGVSDDGPGIERDQLLKIFKRFQQIDPRPLGSSKGCGLGLSIAKELVDLNLGALCVESQPGQGSKFWFTLPVDEPASILTRHLARLARGRRHPPFITLVWATIDSAVDEPLSGDINAFLSYGLRQNDLLLRVDAHRWLFVLPVDYDEVEQFVSRIGRMHEAANRNRPQGGLPVIDVHYESTHLLSEPRCEILGQVATLCKPLVAQFI